MAINIIGIIVIVLEIPTSNIIDKAITIIVDSVAFDFALIDPNPAREIAPLPFATRIENSHDDGAVAGGDVPSLLQMHIRADLIDGAPLA
jgi:hypothetical protein